MNANKRVKSCWGVNKQGVCVVKKVREWKNRLDALGCVIQYWLDDANKTDKHIETIELYYDN